MKHTRTATGHRGAQAKLSRRLANLGLSAVEQQALSSQGFVASEFRGRGGPYYKLRFRWGGKQVVRYLGSDPQVARAIAQELRVLQRLRQLKKRLRRLAAQARRALRMAKHRLEPLLQERGFHFHGQAIRQRGADTKSQPAARAPIMTTSFPNEIGGNCHERDKTRPGPRPLNERSCPTVKAKTEQPPARAHPRLPARGLGPPRRLAGQPGGAKQRLDEAGVPATQVDQRCLGSVPWFAGGRGGALADGGRLLTDHTAGRPAGPIGRAAAPPSGQQASAAALVFQPEWSSGPAGRRISILIPNRRLAEWLLVPANQTRRARHRSEDSSGSKRGRGPPVGMGSILNSR